MYFYSILVIGDHPCAQMNLYLDHYYLDINGHEPYQFTADSPDDLPPSCPINLDSPEALQFFNAEGLSTLNKPEPEPDPYFEPPEEAAGRKFDWYHVLDNFLALNSKTHNDSPRPITEYGFSARKKDIDFKVMRAENQARMEGKYGEAVYSINNVAELKRICDEYDICYKDGKLESKDEFMKRNSDIRPLHALVIDGKWFQPRKYDDTPAWEEWKLLFREFVNNASDDTLLTSFSCDVL